MSNWKTWQKFAAAFVVWQIVAAMILGISLENLRGNVGKVWSDTKAAIEKVGTLQNQSEFFATDRQKLVDKITAARMDYDAAKASGDLAQLDQAMTSLAQIKLIVESYPQVDLSATQVGLMDETAGAINRVNTSRKNLIDAQVGVNGFRIVALPVGFMFPHVDVLGETADPSADLNLPKMGNGDNGK